MLLFPSRHDHELSLAAISLDRVLGSSWHQCLWNCVLFGFRFPSHLLLRHHNKDSLRVNQERAAISVSAFLELRHEERTINFTFAVLTRMIKCVCVEGGLYLVQVNLAETVKYYIPQNVYDKTHTHTHSLSPLSTVQSLLYLWTQVNRSKQALKVDRQYSFAHTLVFLKVGNPLSLLTRGEVNH